MGRVLISAASPDDRASARTNTEVEIIIVAAMPLSDNHKLVVSTFLHSVAGVADTIAVQMPLPVWPAHPRKCLMSDVELLQKRILSHMQNLHKRYSMGGAYH